MHADKRDLGIVFYAKNFLFIHDFLIDFYFYGMYFL